MSGDDSPEQVDPSEEGVNVTPPPDAPDEVDEVDEVDEESFPASDPPSSWAGPTSNPDE